MSTEGETTPQEAVAVEEKAEGIKVFVGNVSFNTRGEDLKNEFAECGNIVSANIIMHGPRSLGYGFVEFATKEEAEKAVATKNKKELDGREINVELAKPRDEAADNERRANRRSRGRGRGRGRGRSGGKSQGAAGTGNGGSGPAGRSRGRGRGRSGAPREDVPREPSTTTIFVRNLPFSVTDEGLRSLFDGFEVVSAKVGASGKRSKGFGFVEFANEAEQKRALVEKDRLECEGRELALRVANLPVEGASKNGDANDNNEEAEGEEKKAETEAEAEAEAEEAAPKEEPSTEAEAN